MNHIILDWYTLAIISSILVSVVGVLQKIALRDQELDTVAFSIYFQFLVGIIALIISIENFGNIRWNIEMLLFIILMGLSYAIASVLYYYSLKRIELSQVKLISATRSLWILLFGLIFLAEPITLNKLTGVLLITLGIAVVYWQKKGFKKLEIPQLFVMLYAVITGVAAILDKHLLDYFSNSTTYMIFSYLLPALLTAVFIPDSISKIKPIIKFNKVNLLIIGSAILLNAATYCLFSALKNGGQISVAGPIWQSSVIYSVIWGILFLKERQNAIKKISGSILVFIGIIFIITPDWINLLLHKFISVL